MNHRIENKPGWAGFAHRARSAKAAAVSACLAYVEQRAIEVLRDQRFERVDVVEAWLNSRTTSVASLVKEFEASDSAYLDSLDALDGPVTPLVMRNFAVARSLSSLVSIATLGPLPALLEAAYELSVVSDDENAQLLQNLSTLIDSSERH